jgi:Vam6/Vps39-like protein vacuolar protein sorting-associated protein 39
VGLNTGSLRVYRVNDLPPPPPPPSKPSNGTSETATTPTEDAQPSQEDGSSTKPAPKPTDLLREIEKFSPRAIEQLAVVKEACTIISLSNYQVSLYDLQSYELIEHLSRSKNASGFAVTSNIVKDPATGIPEIISRLAVAVKRRLLLWSWHESELSAEVGEVVLTESIRSVTWASATKVVCGMNSGYAMVDVITNETGEIIGSGTIGAVAGGQASRFGAVSSAGMGYMGLGGYMPKPLATKLADGEMLLAKDINTLFVTDEGKPTEKKQIPWQTAPESIGYSYPYILALQAPAKGLLEVRNPDTLSLLQTISLPGAAQLHFPWPTVSLPHAAKGFHISSDRCVWKMGATDYDSQVDELVKSEKYDEAISILNMLEDALLKNKIETLREIKMTKAEMLFKQKKYRESMDLFNEDTVYAPPERVLRLFPPMIAGELSGWIEDNDNDAQPEDEAEKANGDSAAKTEATPEISSPSRGMGFTKLLMGNRKAPPASDAASITSKKDGVDTEDTSSSKGKSTNHQGLEAKDLTNAVFELNSYLAGTRARLQRAIDPATGKLNPRHKNGTSEAALKSLLTKVYDESEMELEEELRRTFRLVDTTLFRSYMFSRPTLARSLFRIPNFCDPEVVNEKLLEHNRYDELVDFFYGKKLHAQALELLQKFGTAERPDEAAPTLHGPQRTIVYLQNLPPSEIDSILKYSEWTLKERPDLAMEIFVGDTENAETLPRDRVANFLDGVDRALEVQYLEHIVTELNDLTPDFHNRLVELLINILKETKRDDKWDDTMERFVNFLRESEQYGRGTAFKLIPRDGMPLKTTKLIGLVIGNSIFHWPFLTSLTDPSFYEAQAVVLSHMGQHKQALEIYVFKMKNYAKAEE